MYRQAIRSGLCKTTMLLLGKLYAMAASNNGSSAEALAELLSRHGGLEKVLQLLNDCLEHQQGALPG